MKPNQKAKMKEEIQAYNNKQEKEDKEMCDLLAAAIVSELSEAEYKIWHGHPVWFLDRNPIVGYSKQKGCIRLMFWSGADFGEEKLKTGTGKFKDASVRYTAALQVDSADLKRWLEKSRTIQYDYKNIVKKKGKLELLR